MNVSDIDAIIVMDKQEISKFSVILFLDFTAFFKVLQHVLLVILQQTVNFLTFL